MQGTLASLHRHAGDSMDRRTFLAAGGLGVAAPLLPSAAVAAANEELGPDASLDALVRLALRKAAK